MYRIIPGINKFFKLATIVNLIVFISRLAVFADKVKEDAANTGFQLLEEPVNPRFIAMGTAGTALSGSGFSYYNPALPFLIKETYFTIEYGQYPQGDLQRGHFEVSIPVKNWFFCFSPRSESVNDIYRTYWEGKPPNLDAPTSAQLTHIALDIGYSQWENFAFALSVNGIQDRIFDYYAYALSVSAGAVYIAIPEHLIFGFSVLHLGTTTSFLDTTMNWSEGESLPVNSRLGVSWTDMLKSISYTVSLDIVYRNVRDTENPYTRYIQNRFTVPVGLEIKPIDQLSIRMGKRINMPTEIIDFGAGLNLYPFAVDISFVIPKLMDDTEIKWLTSISCFLRRKSTSNMTIKKEMVITPGEDTVQDTIENVSPVKSDKESLKIEEKIYNIENPAFKGIDTAEVEKNRIEVDSIVTPVIKDTIKLKKDISSNNTVDTVNQQVENISSESGNDNKKVAPPSIILQTTDTDFVPSQDNDTIIQYSDPKEKVNKKE